MSVDTPFMHPLAASRRPAIAGGTRSRAAAGLPLMAAFAIHLLVLGSMFSGLPGPAALGELRGDGTAVGVPAFLIAAVLSGAIVDVRGIKSAMIFLPLAACIVLSFAFNAEQIANAHFLGREGGEKFITSLMVLAFYFWFFFAACSLAQVYGVRAMLLCGGNAAFWCGYLMLAEMAIEIVSWFVPPVRQVWLETRSLWVSQGSSAPMFRLVGFAPEPSLGAITVMGFLGLLLAQIVMLGGTAQWTRGRSRAVWFLVFVLFAVELFLANARTFAIGVGGAGVAGLLVSPFARRIPAALRSAAIVLLPMPVQGALVWVALQQDPATRSISNITRSAGMFTASHLWAQHPLFGVGLGQYGFHFRDLVPSWGLGSFEISRYFRDDQHDLIAGLPPSFSMFSRVAAELGLIGLLAWLLPPFLAIRGAIRVRPAPLTNVIICALSAQIWCGLSFDSYRTIYYWFWLAMLLAWPRQFETRTILVTSWPVVETRPQGARAPDRGSYAGS